MTCEASASLPRGWWRSSKLLQPHGERVGLRRPLGWLSRQLAVPSDHAIIGAAAPYAARTLQPSQSHR